MGQLPCLQLLQTLISCPRFQNEKLWMGDLCKRERKIGEFGGWNAETIGETIGEEGAFMMIIAR